MAEKVRVVGCKMSVGELNAKKTLLHAQTDSEFLHACIDIAVRFMKGELVEQEAVNLLEKEKVQLTELTDGLTKRLTDALDKVNFLQKERVRLTELTGLTTLTALTKEKDLLRQVNLLKTSLKNLHDKPPRVITKTVFKEREKPVPKPPKKYAPKPAKKPVPLSVAKCDSRLVCRRCHYPLRVSERSGCFKCTLCGRAYVYSPGK